jgi:hypothetical protein
LDLLADSTPPGRRDIQPVETVEEFLSSRHIFGRRRNIPDTGLSQPGMPFDALIFEASSRLEASFIECFGGELGGFGSSLA